MFNTASIYDSISENNYVQTKVLHCLTTILSILEMNGTKVHNESSTMLRHLMTIYSSLFTNKHLSKTTRKTCHPATIFLHDYRKKINNIK